MKKYYSLGRKMLPVLFIFILSFFAYTPQSAHAQIYAPEGLNMPGAWNSWANPPSNMALASSTQVPGGRVTKITSGIPRWQTYFSVAASGGDLTGGTYNWLFTSGSLANPWSNKWAGVNVSLNTIQSYSFNSGADNSITLTNGKWYTMNWKDNGYLNTEAIFMETSAQPVDLLSLSVPTGVIQNQSATVTLTTANLPSAQEIFYLRYTTNSWVTSSLVSFNMSGNTGTATIPGQGSGTTVQYYAFSSTVSGITSNYDLYTLKLNNNSGNNYSYSISGLSAAADILTFSFPEQVAPATINATAGTVNIQVAYGTSLNNLTPSITVSPGASINPLSGTAQNFSVPVNYLVTAENGTTTKSWTVTVTVAALSINWANLQWPASQTIEPGQPFNVYGQVWINGYTGGATAFGPLQAWVGYSSTNTDPATWTQWIPATFNGPSGNNDEFVANLGAAITLDGTYYYATRYTLNNIDYVYGGYSSGGGGFWNGTGNNSGVLTAGFNIDCSTFNGTAYSTPEMPLDNESVTVYFDATKGNGALFNFLDDVYAHTAVLTNLSTGPSDWRYIKTNWGINTPETKLTRISANLYSLTINTPRSYYGVPAGETIRKMVFVFRSDLPQSGGSYLEHRNADGSDITLDVFDSGIHVNIKNPSTKQTIFNQSTTLPVCVSALGNTTLAIYANNTLITQQPGSELSYMLIMSQLQSGQNWIKAVASNGTQQARDSVEVYLRGAVQVAELPAGAHNGINYTNDSTVTLVLHDPTGFKQFVYAIGDYSNWQVNDACYMKRTPDGKRYWVTLTGIEPGEEYAYQYYIDGELKIADPYTEKVLDPWNDQWISSTVYPNLKPYPGAYTDGVVSVFQTARPAYNWLVPDFTPPALNNTQSDLVIYEMLLRDFTSERTYEAAMEKLDYLKDLGVNAIELMPVNEFDGNESWGYSTNFFMAADKYYGTREALKGFIDAAHQKGIAVVLDMVVNHAFGLNPMVRMYWNSTTNQPSEHNPWFNQQSPHPYSVGYDFNHESGHTRQFFKDVFQYWLNEYKVDGFRLDLSKGLTQNYSGSDLGIWNAYDQSRINILNDYKAHIKWVNPDAYIILEHFANNDEETVLANSGFLLWSAMHNNYKQVAMGWQNNSNVSWAYHGNRGWTYPNLVDYMETHDEERMMYEALNNGNSTNPTYDIKYFGNALHHQEQGIVLFMGIPGPKMLYEFQEMGYDYSKFFGGSNTANKPPRWDYLDIPGREKLTRVVSAMAALRKSDAFRYGNFSSDLALDGKKIWITHSSMDVLITVNMGVNGFIMSPGFTHAGTWYDYFSGEAITVTDPGGHYFYYNPGDYRVFTSQPVAKPFHNLTVTVVDSETGNPIPGVTVKLSNSGNRITGSDGIASFTSLPKRVYITAEKFGWLSQTVDSLIGTNTNLTIELEEGWEPSISWVNLEWPGNGNIQPGQNYNVYSQVWIDGVTNAAEADSTIEAWIGYSTVNTHPSTWTNWVPATYNSASGNNDEYTAEIGSQLLTEGTYYYASRFSKDGGPYAYGGFAGGDGGFWNGTTNISGILTVQEIPAPEITWVNLQYPGNGTITQGQGYDVYAQALIETITGQPTAAPGLQAWIGYSTSNTNPATWTNWVPATFNVPVGNYDEFVANIGTALTTNGTYYYASRFKYNNGNYFYGGYSATGGGIWNGTTNVNGVVEVTDITPTTIHWANLQWPGNGTIDGGGDFSVYGQVYVAGLTGQPLQTPGMEAWVGYSTNNSNPSTWTNWVPANYNLAVGNNDEFTLNLGSLLNAGGTYYYAFRYRLNNGSYYYGGYSSGGGGFWDGTQYTSGSLTVNVTTKTLNVKVFLESLYAGAGSMRQAQGSTGAQFGAGIVDQVTIELHSATAPYATAYSYSAINLLTDGTLSIGSIPGTITGSYYVVVKHRNSIETWSSIAIDFSVAGPLSYDFTTSAAQAYGNNLKASGVDFLIWSGDATQDGIVDGSDMAAIDNASTAILQGYFAEDVNGDGIVDGSDMAMIDNNSTAIVQVMKP